MNCLSIFLCITDPGLNVTYSRSKYAPCRQGRTRFLEEEAAKGVFSAPNRGADHPTGLSSSSCKRPANSSGKRVRPDSSSNPTASLSRRWVRSLSRKEASCQASGVSADAGICLPPGSVLTPLALSEWRYEPPFLGFLVM